MVRGKTPGSSLGDRGGETSGVVSWGSECMDVLVAGSQVICEATQCKACQEPGITNRPAEAVNVFITDAAGYSCLQTADVMRIDR